jgi:hypothetical protein
MLKAITLAKATQVIRDMITPAMMSDVMQLRGSKLGFRTDKDKDPPNKQYPVEVVKDVLIEAVIRGFRPIGNEFNIIAGNFYATKEGVQRCVREWPGLTDLKIQPGVPNAHGEKGALVSYTASWKVDGVADSMRCIRRTLENGEVEDLRIPVRVNSGMGVDAVIGKATSKLFKRIYERLSGSEVSVEGVESDVIDSTSSTVTEVDGPEVIENPLDGVWDEFAGCDQISDAEQLRDAVVSELTDEQTAIVDAWFHETIARIKASRGERSNADGAPDKPQDAATERQQGKPARGKEAPAGTAQKMLADVAPDASEA